ncbi:IMP dehydrogenase [Microbacterium aurum]
MIGSWFAGTIEAPGQLHARLQGVVGDGLDEGRARSVRTPNPTSGHARSCSPRASRGRRSTSTAAPSVEDLVDMITSGVRSSFTYAGASSVPEFHERGPSGRSPPPVEARPCRSAGDPEESSAQWTTLLLADVRPTDPPRR